MNVPKPLVACLACLLTSGAMAAAPGGSLAERYQRSLQELDQSRQSEDKTRAERDALAAQAKDLEDQLIANAAKVQEIEAAYADTQAELDVLNQRLRVLQADLDKDRGRVAQLLAVLQRLDADTPPAMAVRPDDSLAAARSAMQLGSVLPPVYAQAAELAQRVNAVKQTRDARAEKVALSRAQTDALLQARDDLAKLLQLRNRDVSTAGDKLSELHGITEEITKNSGDLRGLMQRIATLRAAPDANRGMRIVTAQRGDGGELAKGSLRLPVVGKIEAGPPSGPALGAKISGPAGLWFEASGGAQAVAPSDSEVVFAGAYQKFGQVLILEINGGYHLTLAGLGRIDVRIGDQVLAGEPVGVLPQGMPVRLYLELRHNGQTVDPAPWMSAELRKAKGT